MFGITPTQSLTYTRDPLGRVVSRTASGPDSGITRYAFTGTDDSPDIQLTATNALSERYVGLPGGVLYTKGYAAASTVWSISNLHGDVTTTITGTTINTGFVYDPYGQPLNPTTGVVDTAATPTTRSGGTTDAWHGTAQRGYEHTGELHQMLMGARTYLPALGIFTATDPVEGGNTTTYTHPADPINHSDLTGMCDGFLGCIGAAASAAGSWAVEHRGAIATGAATAGCMIPAVGWAACGAMQAAAWGVRTQQSLAEGGSVKDAAVDAGFTALTFGYGRLLWGALRYGQAGSLRNMLGGAVRSGWTRQTVGSVWGGSGVRGIGAARLPRAVKGHLWVSTRAANLYPLYRHAMSFRDRDW